MNYAQAIKRLLNINIFNGMKFGLDASLRLDSALGNPSQAFPSIHIAGTNGKGSVTKKIASALEHEGYRVGLYTSPHISSFRERMRVNSEMITETAAADILKVIFLKIDEQQMNLTFFEITTLMAFVFFAQNAVDIAVIETGLGGRHDATNIVNTKLAVITSISLEHTDVLGSTIEAIALEKAGIIKPYKPVVLGPRLPTSLFTEIASKIDARCIPVSGSFLNYEAENCAIAHAALQKLRISPQAIAQGLRSSLPCRLEFIRPQVILDVAHNPDGLTALFQALKQRFPRHRFRIVFGLSKNKDLKACLAILKAYGHAFHIVESPNGRGASSGQLIEGLSQSDVDSAFIHSGSSIANSVLNAVQLAEANDEIVVICGTFFIMHEARKALGLNEPCDDIDMNER